MTVKAVLMGHPSRERWFPELVEHLGGDVEIVLDRVNDRHETGLRCLQAGVDADASHVCIVQDDAIVCRDLLAGIAEAVRYSEDRLVGLYVGNVRPQAAESTRHVAAARAAGRSWLSLPGPWWGVGIVIPTVHLPALIEHYSRSREQNYDRRIERWAKHAGVGCWYTMPSLVDHRHGAENPSLVANRPSQDRHARWFIGEDASALDVDWSQVPPVETGVWRNGRTGQVRKAAPGSTHARRYAAQADWSPVVESRCGECGQRTYEEAKAHGEAVAP